MIVIKGLIIIKCNSTLLNERQWYIYKLNEATGNQDESPIKLMNNPTLNNADLVIQPNSLDYGLYRFVFNVKMLNTSLETQIETFLRIEHTGLVISSLRQRQPMYGGMIEITRGSNQTITFDPFLYSYDLDQIAVISTLKFRYKCQLIESNIQQGFSEFYLDEFKSNSSLKPFEKCFNSTGLSLIFKNYSKN
jgi:hypothetical protein